MATWQFSLHLIPRATLAERFGEVPSRLDWDAWWSTDTEWWRAHGLPGDYAAILHQVLPRMKDHWDKSTRAWGRYDGDIVEVSYDGSVVESFHVRVDVRGANPRYLRAVCQIAAMSDCYLLTEDMMLVEPRMDLLLGELQQSSAFRFVSDPRGFLDSFEYMPRL